MLDLPPIPLLNPAAWLAAFATSFLAYLLGSLLSFARSSGRFLDRSLIRLAVGYAVLPVIVLMVGQAEGLILNRALWIVPAFAGGVLFTFELVRSVQKGRKPEGRIEPQPTAGRALTLIAALPLALWLIYLLGPSSAPPLNYDTLEYHLGVVPHFFRIGGIHPIPHMFYSAQPIATEMLYTLSSVIEGTAWGGASGFVQWMLILLAALLLGRLMQNLEVPFPVSLVLVLAFLLHPIILRLQLDRLTDLTGAIFLLAGGLVWVSRDDESGDFRSVTGILFLMGVLAGGAISSKWTNAGTSALGLGACGGLAVLLHASDTRSPLRGWTLFLRCGSTLLCFGAGMSLVLLPWMVWVALETGNPIAPFGADWFPTERWGGEQLRYLLETHGPLSMMGIEYWSRLLNRLLSPSVGSWPLMLGIALLLSHRILLRREPAVGEEDTPAPELRPLLWAAFIGVVGGFLLWGRLRHAADRFLAPVVAMEFVILAMGIARIGRLIPARMNFGLPIFLLLVVLLLARMGPFTPWSGASIYVAQALGNKTPEEFLREGLGATVPFFQEINDLPPGTRVLAIGEARPYYLRHEVTLSSVFDRHPIASFVESSDSASALREAVTRAGYTHVAVNEFETARLLAFHPPPDLERNARFMELRQSGDRAGMLREFPGWSEFGATPLRDDQRAMYVEFLKDLRREALYLDPREGAGAAFWIAAL